MTIEIMIFLWGIHLVFICKVFATPSYYRVLSFQKSNIWPMFYIDRLLLDVFMVFEGFMPSERLARQILVFESPFSYRIVIEGTLIILFVYSKLKCVLRWSILRFSLFSFFKIIAIIAGKIWSLITNRSFRW